MAIMELAVWSFLERSSEPFGGQSGDRMTRAGCPAAAQPTAVDASPIQLIHESTSANFRCGACGCPVGRDLQVAPSPPDHPWAWTVSIVTRCTGWKRHPHIASAAEASDALELGRSTQADQPRKQSRVIRRARD